MRIFSQQLLYSQNSQIYEPNQVIINGSGTINLLQDGIYNLVCAGGRGGSGGGSWRQDIVSGSTPMEYNSVTISGGTGGKFEGWIYLTKGTYTAVQGANGTSNSFYHITYSQSVYGTSGGASYLRNSNGTNLVYCSGGSRGGLTITYNPNDGNYTSKTELTMQQHHGSNGYVTVDSSAETYKATTGTGTSTFILTFIGAKEDVFAGGIPFTRPNLTANGTLGGTTFAVSASSEDSSSYRAFRAVDNNTSSYWSASTSSAYYYFYNPNPLCVTALTTTWAYKITYIKYNSTSYLNIAGSNDNSTWTNISYTATQGSTTKILQINLANSNYYKYYRIYLTNSYGQFALYELNIEGMEQIQ